MVASQRRMPSPCQPHHPRDAPDQSGAGAHAWAAVVAERLGFTWEEALTLGRAVAGLNAYAKGKALGLFTPTPPEVQAQRQAQRGRSRCTSPSYTGPCP